MQLRISRLQISAIHAIYAYAIRRRTGALQHEDIERRPVPGQDFVEIGQGGYRRPGRLNAAPDFNQLQTPDKVPSMHSKFLL